jgi:FlgD Ig-like domain
LGIGSRHHLAVTAQNYPNPFNPSTTIEFTVRERSKVSLKIYNVAGQLVRTLVDGDRAPGAVHKVAWDGRNDAGTTVSSGVYFYKLVTSDFTQTRKMVLLNSALVSTDRNSPVRAAPSSGGVPRSNDWCARMNMLYCRSMPPPRPTRSGGPRFGACLPSACCPCSKLQRQRRRAGPVLF